MNTGFKYEIQARETEYRGQLFRSRLEATWAAFFDQCEWGWKYEPLDFNGWTPDFLLDFKIPTLVEVKPTAEEARIVADQLEECFTDGGFELLVVSSGLVDSSGWYDQKSIGLLSEFDRVYGTGCGRHQFAAAPIYICGNCRRPTITHEDWHWGCRLNGCYDGNSYITSEGDFATLWNRASTLTRPKFK